MDEALASVAVDSAGVVTGVLEAEFKKNDMRGFPSDLIRAFSGIVCRGKDGWICMRECYTAINDHHKAEALSQALGRALDMATRIDERTQRRITQHQGPESNTKRLIINNQSSKNQESTIKNIKGFWANS